MVKKIIYLAIVIFNIINSWVKSQIKILKKSTRLINWVKFAIHTYILHTSFNNVKIGVDYISRSGKYY